MSAAVRQRQERQKQERGAARKKMQAEKEAEKKRAEEEKGGGPVTDEAADEEKEQSSVASASEEERKEEPAADERKDGGDNVANGEIGGEEATGDRGAAQDEGKEEATGDNSSTPVESHLSIAPQMKLVNGQIVINEESLVVASPDTLASDMPLLAAAPATRFTSATFSKAVHSLPWTHEETALFYRLLSSFGTDFTLLSTALKGRSRGEVKRKYKKEERERPAVVEEALRKRVKMDMSEFSRWRSDKAAAEESKKGGEVKAAAQTEGVAATGGGVGSNVSSASGKKRERVMLNNRAGKRKKKQSQQQVGAADQRNVNTGDEAEQAGNAPQHATQHHNVTEVLYNDGRDSRAEIQADH